MTDENKFLIMPDLLVKPNDIVITAPWTHEIKPLGALTFNNSSPTENMLVEVRCNCSDELEQLRKANVKLMEFVTNCAMHEYEYGEDYYMILATELLNELSGNEK